MGKDPTTNLREVKQECSGRSTLRPAEPSFQLVGGLHIGGAEQGATPFMLKVWRIMTTCKAQAD